MTTPSERERADWPLRAQISWQMIDAYGEPQFYLRGWIPKWAAAFIWHRLMRVSFVKAGK